MPRPRRSGEPAKPFTIYLTPQAIEVLRSSAWAVKKSPGAFVESFLYDPVPDAAYTFTPSVASSNRASENKHPGWRANTVGENVCTSCGGRKTLVGHLPCLGPAEV